MWTVEWPDKRAAETEANIAAEAVADTEEEALAALPEIRIL